MSSLKEKLLDGSDFLYGVELVSSRGTMSDDKVVRIRRLAGDLAACARTDWVSITDNAGGNPTLAPPSLGRPILYAGQEVIIHLSCKDYNRNGLESEAWHLASEGFHNLLTLSGDAPGTGNGGTAKPVFDIDSVGLLTLLSRMNEGLEVSKPAAGKKQTRLNQTQFFLGAVVTNFKLHENEVIPQYLKLEKKIACGARFIINQIGYDSRKIHEQIAYMQRRDLGHVPLIGNVYLLNPRVAQIFHSQRVPGVVVSDALWERCRRYLDAPDRGKAFFLELAAKQSAIYRGLGYRGSYFGGIGEHEDLMHIYDMEKSFAPDDWKEFAKEILYSRPGEFYMLDEDPETKLACPNRLNPQYAASLQKAPSARRVPLAYRISQMMHKTLFTPGQGLAKLGARLCRSAKDPRQGPKLLRLIERAGKATMFGCKDCGDCSLPETAFLCPESQCAKNQRNGPCGGTREGKCEVHDFECIWSRAYDRLKSQGREQELLEHAPVIQDQGLRGTSSWANTWLGRDHLHHPTATPELYTLSPKTGENNEPKSQAGELPKERNPT